MVLPVESSNNENDEEMPHTHLLHALGIISFFCVWILDSFIFEYSIFLAEYIHFIILIISAVCVFVIGSIISAWAHWLKFNKNLPGVIDVGIYAHSRHPMYLGFILMFLSAIISTLSLLSFIPWFFIIWINNKMANYEEKKLLEKFGNEYFEYKKKVPKWILI